MSYDYAKEIMLRLEKSSLKREAREYFLGLKRIQERTGYKSGRLNTSQLASVLRGNVEVFKRKEDVKMVNSAVSILVDSSGSMYGECYAIACASALTLAETLTSVGVQVEVAGFTDVGDNQLIHHIHCAFGERFNRTAVLDSMDKLGARMCSNADAENVLIAYDRLVQVDTSKRILIVLSDGEPSGYGQYDQRKGLQSVTAFVEKDGKRTGTELWGVGIGGNESIGMYYNNNVYVSDDNKMGNALLTLIKQAVTLKKQR